MKTLYFTIFIAALCIAFSIFRILYVLIRKKSISKQFRSIHMCLCILLLILIALTPYVFGYQLKHQGEYMLIVMLIEFLCYILGIFTEIKTEEYLKWREKYKKISEYKHVSAESIAKQYNMEYLPKIGDNLNYIGLTGEMYYTVKSKQYIEFLPINTITGTQNIIWKDSFDKQDKQSPYEAIITNLKNFDEIENLSEILKEMIKIYKDSIEKDIFLSCYNFLLKFDQNPSINYTGTAKLVITDETLLNSKIDYNQKTQFRKECISDFINCFIGYNFGEIIRKDKELANKINELYSLAKEKNLIAKVKPRSSRCFISTYVQKYWLN